MTDPSSNSIVLLNMTLELSHSRLMFATAAISASLIGYQVVMVQVISILQWHHFANMVVSIALLGFAVAGTTLSLWRQSMIKNSQRLLPLLTLMCALTMIMAIEVSQYHLVSFDSYLLFVNASQWFFLVINYVLYFLPFYFGALALGIIFVKHVDQIERFYFINLIGSGAGGLISAFLAWHFLPAALSALFAFLTLFAGVLMVTQEKRLVPVLVTVVAFLFSIYRIVYPVTLTPSEYKSVSRAMNLPAAKIVMEKPSPYGLLQVVSAEGLRYAPGLSLAFTGNLPVKNVVFNNGEWVGAMMSSHSQDSLKFFDYTSMRLPYALQKREKVLILNSGTGFDVAQALRWESAEIEAIEPNRVLVHLLLTELALNNDSIFYQESVNLIPMEPRAYMSKTKKKYDLITLPLVGSFGGTMGMYAMREEYTLTRESFLKLYALLDEDGAISVTTWLDYPFKNPLKLIALLSEVLENKGLSQRSHLVAVRSWGTITFLLSKSPFLKDDVSRIRTFCDSLFFDPLLLPGISHEERSNYNVMNDSSFFSYVDSLIMGNKEELFNTYDFHLRPSTDDKPYFSQFLRWKSFPHLKEVFGSHSVPFLEMGFLISVITFIQLSVLALILVIVPLIRLKWADKQAAWIVLYFGGLGMGYMFFEIVLIQKFLLLFGNAVYAVAWVISAVLISSGLGSYYSRFFIRKKSWVFMLMLITFFLAIYSLILSTILQSLVGLDDSLKLLISFFIIALPSFFMGMPFPAGLRFCSASNKERVPWAWGINGCASVIGAAVASILAVELGFTLVLLLSAVVYLISTAACFFMTRGNL